LVNQFERRFKNWGVVAGGGEEKKITAKTPISMEKNLKTPFFRKLFVSKPNVEKERIEKEVSEGGGRDSQSMSWKKKTGGDSYKWRSGLEVGA